MAKVGIVMGSDSDMPVMAQAADILEKLGVDFEMTVISAALFPMPVIGIPMKTSDLGGVDSLYSIVQMPSGIPVATVAINGGTNAGILAARILAVSDPDLLGRLKAYSESMKNDVAAKAEKLGKIGYREYLGQMKK